MLPANAREYDVLGRRVAIAGSSPAAQAIVARVFRGFSAGDVRDGSPPHYDLIDAGGNWEARAGGSTAYSGPDLTAAIAALESEVIVPSLLQRSDLIQLHGAALCLPTRLEGLGLAAGSGMGKTTLAVALMLRGFLPFSDDAVLADVETMNLSPLRRSFHLSAHSRDLVARALGVPVSWDEHDPPGVFCPPQFAERPAPLRWLFFLERRPGAAPGPAELPPPEAAMAILNNMIGVAADPRRALDACGRITRDVRCFRLVNADLAASVDAIQAIVAAEPAVV
jgi:hypothetical protein